MQLTLSDFTDPKTFEGKTDDQLFDLIRKGKDKMPAEDAARAKNDEIKAHRPVHPQLLEGPAGRHAGQQPAAAPAAAPSSAATTPGSN